MFLIPKVWLPQASMERIITHWTAGTYTATTNAMAHYHILIDGDGKLHRGSHSIIENELPRGGYAAHTLGCNTKSIGITVCCMHGAIERPFDGGDFPMKESQWKIMAAVAAELCSFYGIPVTDKTVLGHGEVQTNLGIAQRGKWDPMVLPWDTTKSFSQAGDAFRKLVNDSLTYVNFVHDVCKWID